MTLHEAIEALDALHARAPVPGEVRLSLDGPVAELVVDAPDARHALSMGMLASLGRAVDALAGWGGSALLLRPSTEDAFCAGGNLAQVRAGLATPEAGARMAEAATVVLDALQALPQVSVGVVPGPAVGGGAELLTAVDARMLAPGAWVQFRQAALGVACGWGGARRLVAAVGRRQALRWLTTSERIDADAAVACGFAEAASSDPVRAARAWLAPVLRLPPSGVRAVKTQLAAGADTSAATAAFAAVWGGPAHRRALGLDED